MSEPFELFDAAGNSVIMHSPKVAELLVEAGDLFVVAPPAKKAVKPAADKEKKV